MVKKGKEKATTPAPAAPAASSKKPAKAPAAKAPKPPREDDFIVFTNSDKDPKPKRPKPAKPAEEEPAGPPKPTVKQIIGGSSWTGKLPVNLLSEHCQKQKWDKPSYDNMNKSADGYSCFVTMRAKHPKNS
ncbi:hypothetical protein PG987_009633 [Apiospora arundinis]